MDLQYAVIGRLNKDHDAYSLTAHQIKQCIVNALTIDVEADDILHVPPNFIIPTPNAHAQSALLAAHPLLHTNHFLLEILPYSKEHEWCQLPWIPEYASETATINIDPLTILPILPRGKLYKGTNKLRDSFAAKIPKQYDVRAPDFSYLIIIELRDFYTKKSELFLAYKATFLTMHDTLTNLAIDISKKISEISSVLYSAKHPTPSHTLPTIYSFVGDLKTCNHSMETSIINVKNAADSIVSTMREPLNLESYKEGPSSSEIDVPVGYSQRLRTIFDTVIQRIHNTKPIIETIKERENRFETYVTIANFTRRYYGSHKKSAEAMETAAIFYSLKHIANVRGYKIVDLNYSTLATMVVDLDKWNSHINMLEVLPDFMLNRMSRLEQEVDEAYNKLDIAALHPSYLQKTTEHISQLFNIIHDYSTKITCLIDDLHTCKDKFMKQRIGIYSPSTSYYRWGRAKRPQMPVSSNQ